MPSPSKNNKDKSGKDETTANEVVSERTKETTESKEKHEQKDNESNSGWGEAEEKDSKNRDVKKDETEWDTKASTWNTEQKDEIKRNSTSRTPSTNEQHTKKETSWIANDNGKSETVGNWCENRDDNSDLKKEHEENNDNQGWNTFDSSRPPRQFSQRNDLGWGRNYDGYPKGYQPGPDRGNQRFGRNDYERSNQDGYDRNRRGGRDIVYQRRDGDGYGRGGLRNDEGYRGNYYGNNEGYRQGGYRSEDNYRRDDNNRNDYNRRENYRGADAVPSQCRGNTYGQERGFDPRNKPYKYEGGSDVGGNQNINTAFGRDIFGQQEGHYKRKSYQDHDKRSRQNFYTEGLRDQSPSYQSNHNAPRRDFPDNEATRRFKKPRPINPPPSKVIGIFGMPISSTETDVEGFILDNCPDAKFNDIRLVKNHMTGYSKGFCFVYFNSIDESILAKEGLTGKVLQGNEVRVDFSTSPEPRPRFNREE